MALNPCQRPAQCTDHGFGPADCSLCNPIGHWPRALREMEAETCGDTRWLALTAARNALHHAAGQRIGIAMDLCLVLAASDLHLAGEMALAAEVQAQLDGLTSIGEVDRIQGVVDALVEGERT